MREINFKGYDTQGEEWVFGQLLKREGAKWHDIVETISRSHSVFTPVAKGSEAQYTGLKDDAGVKIYENDILERIVSINVYGMDTPTKHIKEYLLVEYREEYGGFFIGERSLYEYVDRNIDVWTQCSCTKPIVVGNKFTDAHLLEGELDDR